MKNIIKYLKLRRFSNFLKKYILVEIAKVFALSNIVLNGNCLIIFLL